jgi:prepilin-type N-terminal cleavage/methylation domain-containing protein
MRFASEQSNMNIKASTSQNAARGAQAFTLIEVMVSVALLAIMMAAIYPAFVIGFASIKTTREDERATQIVTQKLESFRLLTFNEQLLCPTSFVEYYDPYGSNNSQGALYAGTITIATNTTALNQVIPNTSYQSNVRLITIGVTWTNTINNNPVVHTRQMQTLSAYWGLQNYLYGFNSAQ